MNDRPEKIDLSDIKSRKVDENMLNELRDLFEKADEQKERYDFTWNGKARAFFEAASPATKTFIPNEKDSVNFKNSENLFITGDNLEALKLMQEAYLGKIDVIYVDPPYNTGKDFVYHDNFRQNKKESDLSEGNIDEDGNRLIKNDKNNGRFHSDWLSMMYPRLKLARNLLSDKGMIFISIDDNEQANLKIMMDEIFGESNFVENFINRSNPRGNQAKKFTASEHEYILSYAKNKNCISPLGKVKDQSEFNKEDENGKYVELGLRKRGAGARRQDAPNQFYPIYFLPSENKISVNPIKDSVKILPRLSNGEDGRWRWSSESVMEKKDKLIVRMVKRENGKEYDVFEKKYYDGTQIKKEKSIFYESSVNNENATEELKELFNGKKIFDFPKPVYTIKKILEDYHNKDAVVFDFFGGSGTTADAVMQLNHEDHGNRKFIICTLDESIPDDAEARKLGYKTIDQISKDRIKKSAKKINDISGYRTLDIANTKINQNVFKKASELNQDNILLDIDNNYDNQSDYELLYDVLISSAFEYNREITIEMLNDEKIIKYDYFGEISGVIAYFGDNLTNELVLDIAKSKPLIAAFKESTFDKSSRKVNLLEQFRVYSPDTKVKVI